MEILSADILSSGKLNTPIRGNSIRFKPAC